MKGNKASVNSSSYVCRTKDGKWYTPSPDGNPMETNLEAIRMTHGESVVNAVRRTKGVVMVTLTSFDLDPDEFTKKK